MQQPFQRTMRRQVTPSATGGHTTSSACPALCARVPGSGGACLCFRSCAVERHVQGSLHSCTLVGGN